jgi:hypothetical protein
MVKQWWAQAQMTAQTLARRTNGEPAQ